MTTAIVVIPAQGQWDDEWRKVPPVCNGDVRDGYIQIVDDAGLEEMEEDNALSGERWETSPIISLRDLIDCWNEKHGTNY